MKQKTRKIIKFSPSRSTLNVYWKPVDKSVPYQHKQHDNKRNKKSERVHKIV